jgi:hypothetical protein
MEAVITLLGEGCLAVTGGASILLFPSFGHLTDCGINDLASRYNHIM